MSFPQKIATKQSTNKQSNNQPTINCMPHERHTLYSSPPSGSKYVPPHLRNSQGGGNSGTSRGSFAGGGDGGGRDSGRDSGRGGGGGYNDSRRGSYNDRGGGGGGGDRRDSYNDRGGGGGGGPPTQTNSRWSNDDGGGGGGGGGGYSDNRGGGYNDRGGGGGGGRGGYGRTNERGFHGDMTPDKRLEARLFEKADKQTTGINFDNYDKIPIETSGENIPDPIETYTAETIGEDLFRNTQLCGYSRPTPVQKYSIPIASAGRDLMACAQTGSGKTAGFLFPIIMAMINRKGIEPPESNGRSRRTYPNALVLAPTRELAQQIHEEGRRFTYCTGIASVVIYGGADVRDQLRQIERGCDLLVATPGRLVDLIERGRIAMECVHFMVLDEADRM
jgi:ATP-dependent RNA helicase DDX3X